MKNILSIIAVTLFIGCKATKTDATVDYAKKFAKTITQKELKKQLYTYASDEFEGRNTGEPGQKKAVAFLKDFYIKMEKADY